MYFRTQAAIDLDAVEYNFTQTRNKLPKNVKILCVVKADAYGHGAVQIAKCLDGKCDFFGVACVEEALELQNAGVKAPIMILGHTMPSLFKTVVENDIRISVFTYADALALSEEAVRQNKIIPFHFCVDTGMSRIGMQVSEESADLCKKIIQLPNIEAEGLFSHFATADEADLSKARLQKDKFDRFIKMLEDRDISISLKHISNSAAIMNFDDCYDMCRMGIISYGLYPSAEMNKSLLSIKPAMSWITHISYLKTLEEGREISYGGTYKTTSPRVIATIPVGYADGYPRSLSNKGRVIINGKFAPIVGRVCMDQFMVDVTGIDDIDVNSTVTLIGKNGDSELAVEEVSELAGSFNYEFVCCISKRVPRTYYKEGRLVSVSSKL